MSGDNLGAFCGRLHLDGWEHLHEDGIVVLLLPHGCPEVAERALALYRPELEVVRLGDDLDPTLRVVPVAGRSERRAFRRPRLQVSCLPPVAAGKVQE